jgi:hypothetical protein
MNKEFSKNFLENLLESAVTFYKTNKNVKKLPLSLKNINDPVILFMNALEFEAHNSLQNEIISKKTPILHAVNLTTKNPGIISGKSEKENKLIVYKKLKEKKEKTPEQIEKEMQKVLERLKIKEEKDKKRKEEKELEKEKKNIIKDEKKKAKVIYKDLKKSKKVVDKINKNVIKAKKNINKKKNPNENELNEVEELTEKANVATDNYIKIQKEYTDLVDKTSKMEDEIIQKKLEKKKIKEQKNIERKILKEEREKKKQEKKREKARKIAEKIDENDMNIYDELFDLAIEAKSSKNEDEEILENNKEIDDNSLKIYESPLPHKRHIDALNFTDPNEKLLPTLLEGKQPLKDSYIKCYHGPPGTGKTYRLMLELQKLIKQEKYNRILVCAPSNIAVINMYTRAKKFNIKGTLAISESKIPDYIKNNKEEVESWDHDNANIVFSTISMRFGRKLRNQVFKTILMDEAAQCQEAWMWGLLRPEVKYIHMAGDPNQLPALVSDEGVELNHGRSLMERLIKLGYKVELLDTQRRMHPKIVDFPNINFYDGKLKSDYKDPKLNIEPFLIYDVKGQEKIEGTSYMNKKEVEKVVEIYNELKNIVNEIIVIAPYQAQCNLLKKMNKNIKIHTVDSFQGNEADAVIMTTVRSGNNIGFWSDYRRLNVGMTRSKHILRIVGNVNSWEKSDNPLKKLAIYGRKKNIIQN